MLNFLHAGTFGDTVYALSVIKILGGGNLYLELNGMDKLAMRMWGGGDAGDHRGRYTKKDIDFIMPLIEKQSYINSCEIWNNQQINHDLRNQYQHWAGRNGRLENWLGNQTECYAATCGLDYRKYQTELLLAPWLDSVEPICIPGRPILINRTPRHIRRETFNLDPRNPHWQRWINNFHLEDLGVFVGTPKEHHDFCQLYNCNIPYQKVTDMLELARLIKGSEQFIGNQSMALSLAVGLGKTFWCEIRVDYNQIQTDHGFGDVWFPRANAHYF